MSERVKNLRSGCVLSAMLWVLSSHVIALTLFAIFAGAYLSAPTKGPAHADLIAILGGGTGDRLVTGSRLYDSGWANQVLVTGFPDAPDTIAPLYAKWRAEYLIERGVREQNLLLDSSATSTRDEARYIKVIMQHNKWKTVILVSDPPHARRLSQMFVEEFSGQGLEFRIVSSRPQWWSKWRWWSTGKGAAFVVTEFVKLLVYRLSAG